MTTYLLDSNVFIQAKNLHYGFDFVPGFWAWLIRENQAGSVASIEKVRDELRVGGDELSEWAEQRDDGFFLTPDSAVVEVLPQVSDWSRSQDYDPAAVATFLQIADFWLVAHALAHSCIVVTHETPADTTKKIKIPNACTGLGLHWISPYQMLRQERARLILG